jgi:tRNA(Ile)-lysidine synthetase-like protein
VARAPAALRLVADRAARALAAAGVPGRGDGLAVAVSGGADSLALLHALRTLAWTRDWRLEVVTVDHGMRPGSAADAAFVVDNAKALGLGAHHVTVAAADLDADRGAGPEGAARAARYRALAESAAEAGCRFVATGHTMDDQAETVVLQLLRGTGPDGLGAMAVRDGWLLRPLLGVRRSETRACCRALDLAWREDPSNADQRLLRNAVRLRVLPLLEELRPGSTRTLARTAGLARSERDWLDPIVSAALDSVLLGRAPATPGAPAAERAPARDQAALGAAALADLPVALGRRVVRAACRRAGCATPAAETVDRVLDLANPARGNPARGNPARGNPSGNGATVRWPGGHARRVGEAVVLAQPDDWPDAPANRARSGALR